MSDWQLLMNWLGGPVGVAFAWAIIFLVQAVTAVLMRRLQADHKQIQAQLSEHIEQVNGAHLDR